jgi:4-amino-4-deoxy-L-arabinose transferase-like glycosyltransferase
MISVAKPRQQWLLDGLLGLAPLVIFVLLAVFVMRDPAGRVTSSNAPYTDEAWDLINPRNFVLFGHFSTDDWNLHLVNLPYSIIQAAVFTLAGVGMAQGRIVSIMAVALTMATLGWGLRRQLGTSAAILAALAFGTSTLVLYYGRLAFLEPLVALFLTIGGLLTLRAFEPRSGRWGLTAGLALALAIGTKPSAAFASVGILAGLGVLGWRSPAVRRWLLGATCAIVLAGLGWIVLIGLPNQAAIGADLRIWPSEPIFGSLSAMGHRILEFVTRNDRFTLFAAPILVFGGLGWITAIRHRKALPTASIVLLATATGWGIAGFGILALAPYRPNRYEVPLLPALAILGAVGWSVVTPKLQRASPRWARIAAVGVTAAIALPGLFLFGSWMQGAPSTLPAIQASVRVLIPPGAAVQGIYAPAFALQAQAVALVSHESTQINPGDLYATRDVRWYLGAKGTAPQWANLHAAAWSERVLRYCAPWGGADLCLWQVP